MRPSARPIRPGLTMCCLAMLSVAGLVPAPAIAQQLENCRITGRVIDADFETPIAGAMVWLETLDGLGFVAGTTSSTDGTFSLDVRSCGAAQLKVQMLGYDPSTELIEFDESEQSQQVTIRLARAPIEVEELRVDVPQSNRLLESGFYARRAWVESTERDYGQFYEPEEVARRSVAYEDAIGLAMASRIHFLYSMHGTCGLPSFYVDGRPFGGRGESLNDDAIPELTPPALAQIVQDQRDINSVEVGENYRMVNAGAWMKYLVPFEDIEGMEIYRPVHGAIPDEFREANSNLCGAVLIWTKSGGRLDRDYIAAELCESTPGSEGTSLGGVVTDNLTGVPLLGARVTLITERTGGFQEELETMTDVEGRYRYCDILAAPVRMGARYRDAFGPESGISAFGDWNALDLGVPVLDQGTIAGRVTAEGDLPSDLEIALDGTSMRRQPDAEGYFEFAGLPPRDYVVTVAQGGEVVSGVVISVRPGETEDITLELPTPQTIR